VILVVRKARDEVDSRKALARPRPRADPQIAVTAFGGTVHRASVEVLDKAIEVSELIVSM
jgi:hypothetical protein